MVHAGVARLVGSHAAAAALRAEVDGRVAEAASARADAANARAALEEMEAVMEDVMVEGEMMEAELVACSTAFPPVTKAASRVCSIQEAREGRTPATRLPRNCPGTPLTLPILLT